MYGMENVKFIT